MSRSPRLTLIAPHLLVGATNEAPATCDGIDVIARLAGRGQLVRRWVSTTLAQGRLSSWQRALLGALDLDEESHPSAATSALGAGIDAGANQWLHADAVHFAAGMNEVTLVPLPNALALTAEDRAAIAPLLAEHLAATAIRFHATPGGWFLETPLDWDIHTVTPQFATQHPWGEVLPRGNNAGALRRLMTELQMLLHDHPVNSHRAARGLPAANAIWFWGDGRLAGRTHASTSRRVRCWGNSAYLGGLCRLHGWAEPDAPSVEAMITGSHEAEHLVCIVDASDLHSFATQWLAPLMNAVRRGVFSRLDVDLDDWRLSIDRWSLKRFWRRDRPLNTWASA